MLPTAAEKRRFGLLVVIWLIYWIMGVTSRNIFVIGDWAFFTLLMPSWGVNINQRNGERTLDWVTEGAKNALSFFF